MTIGLLGLLGFGVRVLVYILAVWLDGKERELSLGERYRPERTGTA